MYVLDISVNNESLKFLLVVAIKMVSCFSYNMKYKGEMGKCEQYHDESLTPCAQAGAAG